MPRGLSTYHQGWVLHNFSGQPVLIFSLFLYKAHSACNLPESLIQKTVSHILIKATEFIKKEWGKTKEVRKEGENGWEWRQFHPNQRKSLCTSHQQAMDFCSLAETPRCNSQHRWGQRQGMKKRREAMLPVFIVLPSLCKTVSLYPDTEKWFSHRNWNWHLSINCLQTPNPLKGWQKENQSGGN